MVRGRWWDESDWEDLLKSLQVVNSDLLSPPWSALYNNQYILYLIVFNADEPQWTACDIFFVWTCFWLQEDQPLSCMSNFLTTMSVKHRCQVGNVKDTRGITLLLYKGNNYLIVITKRTNWCIFVIVDDYYLIKWKLTFLIEIGRFHHVVLNQIQV